MRTFIAVLLLACCVLRTFAGEPIGDPQVTRPILQSVVAGQPPLTRQMHEAFWREIRKGVPMAPPQLRTAMVGAFDLNLEYQRAVWQSASQSARSKTVMRTAALVALDAEYLSRATSLVRLNTGERREMERGLLAMQEDARIILECAASGSPFLLRSGMRGIVNESTVRDALGDLDALKARIDRLLDPVWVGGKS